MVAFSVILLLRSAANLKRSRQFKSIMLTYFGIEYQAC